MTYVRGFNDIDCPACRGFGDRIHLRDRPCGEQTARKLKCRRCRGTGLI